MATPAGLMAHVRRTAEARQPAARDGRRVAVAIDLQSRTDEQVDRILAR
jgi:hypothetical protein